MHMYAHARTHTYMHKIMCMHTHVYMNMHKKKLVLVKVLYEGVFHLALKAGIHSSCLSQNIFQRAD